MVQVLPKVKSFGERLGGSLGEGLREGIQAGEQKRTLREQTTQKAAFLKKVAPDMDFEGASPEQMDIAFKEIMKGKQKQSFFDRLEGIVGEDNEEPSEDLAEEPPTKPKGKKKLSRAARLAIAQEYPGAARFLQHEEDIDQREKQRVAAETAPMKSDIVQKANNARKGIQNKKNMIDIIKRGNIDDPTWAAVAEIIPANLGKRLLSPDTVTYKAAMVDEFADLRNIFQGQTRVKEIEILENKMADLYLTDEQKMGVLSARIDALKADVVREEAAAEIDSEYPGLGLFEFNKKVANRTNEKMDAVAKDVIDQVKYVIDRAENRKNMPLDADNPEDAQIIDQLLEEAGGSEDRAIELAKKKGYKF